MEPYEKLVAEKKGFKELSQIKNITCKNGVFILELEEGDYQKKVFKFTPKNTGCKNPRRNGSAWCQECSDKFKNR